MLGINQRIISMSMHMRTSHLRNSPSDVHTLAHKSLVMVNPEVEPEPRSVNSLQYEFDYIKGKDCGEMRLVSRTDFVSVKFQSIHGEGTRHHLILPFRESRILQYHMCLLDGVDPFSETTMQSKDQNK